MPGGKPPGPEGPEAEPDTQVSAMTKAISQEQRGAEEMVSHLERQKLDPLLTPAVGDQVQMGPGLKW